MASYSARIDGKIMTPEEVMNYISDLESDDDVAPVEDAFTIHEDDDGLSDAHSEHSEHDTDSNISESDLEDESEPEIDNTRCYYGRNKFKWSKEAPAQSRTRGHNILRIHLPGIKGPANDCKPQTPYQAWSLLITEDMLNVILEHTNAKITEMSASYGNNASFVNHLSYTELKAFLGLCYLAGAFKSNHEDVTSLWASGGLGRPIFRATMSKARFLFLLSCIRFDDFTTRETRKLDGDKLAAISDMFNTFVVNCGANYCPSEFLTVDETLVGFRGRCSFRVYLRAKPQKYGLKIMSLCDAKTHYFFNGFIYAGKTNNDPNPNKLSVPTQSVLRLVRPVINTHRNITGDNWFTSIELVRELQKLGLTYVGTIRKNKREIPTEFLPNKKYPVGKNIFGFTADMTIVSFVPKQSKSVVLLSSMHHDGKVDEHNGKPDMILFYNSTKGGVDALDQKCALYRTGRRCRRWPLAIWFAVMDIAAVNSHIIWKGAQPERKMSRLHFIRDLGEDLVRDYMKERAEVPNLSTELRMVISMCLEENVQNQANLNPRQPSKRQRCHLCPRKLDKKYATMCQSCSKTVCKLHSAQQIFCSDCNNR